MGKWAKGQSGNPSGRPKRSEPVRAEVRGSMAENLPAVVKKLTELALGGDVQAIRTFLERMLPPLRPEARKVTLPEVAAAKTPTEQSTLVVKAMAEGVLAPDVASMIQAGLGQAVRVKEIDELEQRLRALEEQQEKSR